MSCRTSLTSWKQLEQKAESIKGAHLRDLFSSDPERFEKFSVSIPGVLYDFSKNLINEGVMASLVELAQESEIESWRDKMFAGEKINITEDRAVLHVALRNRKQTPIFVDGQDVAPVVEAELEKIRLFTDKVRSGEWHGFTGKIIKDVVNIGVGGSNLGPQMVTEALKHYSDERLNVHYVSNADGVQISEVLATLNPETTLFVVASKTFTTSETMANAKTAVEWLLSASNDRNAIAKHFVAVSTNKARTSEFGIADENVFTMWDWVGGRFSLWSAIGLPIALYLGFDAFIELLEGAQSVDEHFATAPLESNIPVIMALLSTWNTSFLGAEAQAILPYDQNMHMLPAYLQQAEMESNGKSVNFSGVSVPYSTVPLIWGMTGINGQHAFYQCLHQGTTIVPADFIGSIEPIKEVGNHHEILMSNFFAQTEAMMAGVTAEQVRQDLSAKGMNEADIEVLIPHKVHQGNRPTTSILLDKISPHSVGQLVALYEHKIFTQGILLQICSFDQWGVELGKGLASKIQTELEGKSNQADHDSSTANLIKYYKSKRTN